MIKLYDYQVLIPFTSISLGQSFKPGQIIKAPAHLGRQWTIKKLTIKQNKK
tara:strand:+ start:1521 stop:1673 length:153 start_codon:yes stop_codon:yes gene_type:complete